MNTFGRLGIGTAQIGMDYGISNKTGKTSVSEVLKIFESAAKYDIRFIDTASAYGDAEEIIGRLFPATNKFNIVTKLALSDLYVKSHLELAVEEKFDDSLRKMGQKTIYGLLAHGAGKLLSRGGERLWAVFQELKAQGKVSKIGASVYRPEEVDLLLERYPLDLVQVPINLMDQRMIRSGSLSKLKSLGTEIHGRSCFLQGLLLMKPKELAPFFAPVKGQMLEIQKICIENKITPLEMALSFVLNLKEIDCTVIGVNSSYQFHQIIMAASRACVGEKIDYSVFAVDNQAILEPIHWPERVVEKIV